MPDQLLAICGGEPRFTSPLHVGRPNIGNHDAFLSLMKGVLERHWLTNQGPLIGELERRLARLLGVRHCICVCNGTVGLELAIRALDLAGEVLVPSFTFVATAHALQYQGITPVFCDVDPRTCVLDPESVEKMITPRTTGILGVHLWGRPCEIDALTSLARSRNLRLIFDAAHAFGSSHQGQMIGTFGDAEVFSFHATKVFNTFEGGAITTNNDEVAHKCRLMRNFGFTTYDTVVCIGTNAKMNEVSAAMGLTNLDGLEEFISANHRNYEAYRLGLEGIQGLRLLAPDEHERCTCHNIVVEVDETVAGLSRDTLMQVLHAENVIARRYFWPGCHRSEPYRTLFPDAGLHLPHTEYLAGRVLSLPTGASLAPLDIAAVCNLIRCALDCREDILQTGVTSRVPVWLEARDRQ
jgi:dTDP-4-amino-4,6-dideoxygalactose transaminase